jgi:uncharacterized protein
VQAAFITYITSYDTYLHTPFSRLEIITKHPYKPKPNQHTKSQRGQQKMPQLPKYEVPTWNQTYEMLLCQAEKIVGSGFQADVIVAISRGGLVPARILSDLTETPQIITIQIAHYIGIGQKTEKTVLKQGLTTPIKDKNVLLVDDIGDSGESLKLAKEHLTTQGAAQIKTATLYMKPSCIVQPDYFEKQTSCWVVFPWDAKEALMETAAKRGSREVGKIIKAGFPKQLAQRLQNSAKEHRNC